MDNDVIKLSNLKNKSGDCEDKEVNKISKNKYNFFNLFAGKNLKIIILIIILLVILVLYFTFSNTSSKEDQETSVTTYYTSTLEYCQEIESKLEKVLSQINGIGQVSVMVSVDGSPKYSLASDTDTKSSTTSNGSTTTTSSSPIIIDGVSGSNPLILTEELPKVKGVIVVATGASKVDIKLDIINSVSTLLDISTDKISVLKGN